MLANFHMCGIKSRFQYKEKGSSMSSFLKQHHTTYPMDDTDTVPTKILEKMKVRDDLRSRDSTSPAL